MGLLTLAGGRPSEAHSSLRASRGLNVQVMPWGSVSVTVGKGIAGSGTKTPVGPKESPNPKNTSFVSVGLEELAEPRTNSGSTSVYATRQRARKSECG